MSFSSEDQNFKLPGNDHGIDNIRKWYEEEEAWHDRFSNGRNDKNDYWIVYEVFNRKYAINKHVKFSRDSKILSFGCAEGSDTSRLYDEHKFQLFGVEASAELIDAFKKNNPEAVIVKAQIDGSIDYPDESFDHIFCFGVLHHIPNVSFIIKEFHRVLKTGGVAVIREPLCWMYSGKNRPDDLSPNERGIPESFFRKEFTSTGFELLEVKYSFYKPLMSLIRKFGFIDKFPGLVYHADKLLCSIPRKHKYYPQTFLDRFTPSSAYYIVKKS